MRNDLLKSLLVILLLAVALAGALWLDFQPAPTPTQPTPLPQPTSTAVAETLPLTPAAPASGAAVLISEVQAGVSGNNNLEFIELTNTTGEVIDLRGWSVWYRLASSTSDLLVYRWSQTALLPPYGFYLLGRSGETLPLAANAVFEQALNTTGGSLVLRATDGAPVDSLGWGKSHPEIGEGSPAPALGNGQSVQRRWSGSASWQDRDDNAADFALSDSPDPQNSGSPALFAELPVSLALTAPETIEPGAAFRYELSLSNTGAAALADLIVTFPLPSGLELTSQPENTTLNETTLTWQVAELPAGQTAALAIPVQAPYTYLTALAHNYYVSTSDASVVFGAPLTTQVSGGRVPIGAARTLNGAELTIEGVVTMYTGGYFAGNGNTKLYLQDETGGIQVQVFGGAGKVQAAIGARVRVRGEVSVYRGAEQIVPILVPEDVEILAAPGADLPAPTAATIAAVLAEGSPLAGQLVQVAGLVTRVEEFTYSHEVDLISPDGEVLTLYVDKQTLIEMDTYEAGQNLVAAGILEVRDDVNLLYPRLQSDLAIEYPPVVALAASAPNNVAAGEAFSVTLTVTNHRSETLTGLQVSWSVPAEANLSSIADSGTLVGDQITWSLPDLAPESSASVNATLVAPAELTRLTIQDFSLAAPAEIEVQTGEPYLVFVGESLPVWAIQGSGLRSPYLGQQAQVQGVVTGVFPELGGFWLQEILSDADPATSAGLFIQAASLPEELTSGDLVQVRGVVREPAQQTALLVSSANAIQILERAQPLPTPIDLDPPPGANAASLYYEALEGMLVQVREPAVAVAPVNRYGEYALVLARHGVTRLYQGEDNGWMITVDDGSSIAHQDGATLLYAVASGDLVSEVLGPLAYTYGKFKIEPLQPPLVSAAPRDLPSLPLTAATEISVMTWNVENLFDTRDPHPSDPPRPRLSEYQADLTKVANTILSAGAPLVVALQEVENIGVLDDLAAHELLVAWAYQPVLIEGFDSRGIDVGYLVRTDRVEILGVEQFDAPEGLTSRPPLLLRVRISTSQGDLELALLNNHFTSMSGGELATEPRRLGQAEWNVEVLQTQVLADQPDALAAVLGDLNSFYESAPIDALRQAGLRHVLELLDPAARYNYIFEGESQVLDHILVTDSLWQLLRRVYILHVNADYPLPPANDLTPQHKSDHDPLIAIFSLEP